MKRTQAPEYRQASAEKVCFLFIFCFGNEICIGSTWEGARGIVMCLQIFRNEKEMPLFGEPCLFGEPVERSRGMPRQAVKQLRTHACTGNCIELLKQYSWVHWELSAGLATSTVFNSFEKHGLLQYENNVVRDSILQETLTVRGSLFEVGHDLSDGRKNKLHNSNN